MQKLTAWQYLEDMPAAHIGSAGASSDGGPGDDLSRSLLHGTASLPLPAQNRGLQGGGTVNGRGGEQHAAPRLQLSKAALDALWAQVSNTRTHPSGLWIGALARTRMPNTFRHCLGHFRVYWGLRLCACWHKQGF